MTILKFLLLSVFPIAELSSDIILKPKLSKYGWKNFIWNCESTPQHTGHSSFDVSRLAMTYFSWICRTCTYFNFTVKLLRRCQLSRHYRLWGIAGERSPSWPWSRWCTAKERLPAKQNLLKCASSVLTSSTGNKSKHFCPKVKLTTCLKLPQEDDCTKRNSVWRQENPVKASAVWSIRCGSSPRLQWSAILFPVTQRRNTQKWFLK